MSLRFIHVVSLYDTVDIQVDVQISLLVSVYIQFASHMGWTMKKIAVIGNGNSRKRIDLDFINFRTYGCNALYRDYNTDVLVSVDNGMMQEIYTEYTGDASIWFRSWNPLPAEIKEMLPIPMPVIEKGSPCAEFTLNGADWGTHITWLSRDEIQPNIVPSGLGIDDWSTGTTAIRLACEMEKPDTVYLIGFDIGSRDDNVNNVYAGTLNYLNENESARVAYESLNSAENWRLQHCRNFVDYEHVRFVSVGNVLDWASAYSNVEYMSCDNFEYRLLKDEI